MKKKIRVDYFSRVEGEGGIRIEIKDGEVHRLDLNIFEAPRFFEPLLRGRSPQDIIDFTARICGICPVAYQMSAVHAIEAAMGIEVEEPVRQLRRLLYAGEWIESHALHVYFLHGPDFYNLESAWTGKGYKPFLQRGLMLKKAGNEILTLLGGRPIHPVSVRAGGFFTVPEKKKVRALIPFLENMYVEAINGITWAASLFNGVSMGSEIKDELVSLKDPEGYPMNRGRIVTSGGADLSMEDFLFSIEEYQVSHSTALHTGIKVNSSMKPYMAGPLSRIYLNHDCLPEEIKTAMNKAGIALPFPEVKMSIIARSIEISYALFEAIRIMKDYEEPPAYKKAETSAGTATWITEAPRGILIHHYEFDGQGKVLISRIIPPTSQNLAHIKKTLYGFVESHIDKPVDYLRKNCEQIVRSYDPCISCSVHMIIL